MLLYFYISIKKGGDIGDHFMAFEIYFLCLYAIILMLEFLPYKNLQFWNVKTFGNHIV